ncbi:MAG: hypothetical protein ACVCEJ_08835 [Candidatus Izemoplasmataceae bacterium]
MWIDLTKTIEQGMASCGDDPSTRIKQIKTVIEDGLFFGIYAILFISFILKSKIAHYFLTVWLFLWFVTQFFSHWYYTLTNSSAQKIAYFYDTIKLIDSSSIYIPDLYQIILHLFILSSFICMIVLSRGLNKSST